MKQPVKVTTKSIGKKKRKKEEERRKAD